ncbi:MAG: hypothetical protein QM778_38630 [Myxococcales bacterium]
MRTMLKVTMPVEAGNQAIKEGTMQKVMMAFANQCKPEAAYFIAEGGDCTGVFVFDLKDPTTLPSVCEPFFFQLKARVTVTPTMNMEEMKAGIERAMRPM